MDPKYKTKLKAMRLYFLFVVVVVVVLFRCTDPIGYSLGLHF